ncbi:MAG TPA: hypothetical protein VGX91_07045 [Candidatus Cybelea sp.]|jgi:protein ImuB|nr:hypothetical protein [Candidatus Cybelea sp.]
MLLCVEIAGELPEPVLWEEMLDALDAVSPLVDDDRCGLAFLDMHGAAGSARDWIAQAQGVLAGFDLALRVGAGSNKIAARAASVSGNGVCDPGTERELLEPLPLALLGIEPEIVERLALLGIERLGELAALPHGPFVRRFGAVAAAWHELARGVDRRPFTPRSRVVTIEAVVFGEGRADEEAQVFFALRMLLARICSDLERCGKRAGALQLALELEDAATCTFYVPLATPTAHERTMFELLRAKLEGETFESAIVGLHLQAHRLEEGGEEQTLLRADDFDPARVAVTIARLEALLGERISRATTREAHLLEERFSYEPFAPPARAMLEHTEGARELIPQLRLLEVREISVALRAGAPAIVDRQAVMQYTGPWRIQERELMPSPVTRDEYDVVLEDGTFARIYRQGTHWYLRGVYE